MPLPIEIVLFVFLLILAVVIATLEDLFAAAMLTGIFSLLSAGLFTIMDAVDVAFTEAAVGAGVATVFILCTLSLTAKREYQQPAKVLPFIAVGITGAALIYGTFDMPAYGDPDAVAHRHLSAKFIEIEERAMLSQNEHAVESAQHGSKEKAVGLPNIVTSILASYRGYDTFGEATVIFTAAIGVMLLLRGRRRERKVPPPDRDQVETML
jgi:multicomponent Na+:H+ antiporter subunit B